MDERRRKIVISKAMRRLLKWLVERVDSIYKPTQTETRSYVWNQVDDKSGEKLPFHSSTRIRLRIWDR